MGCRTMSAFKTPICLVLCGLLASCAAVSNRNASNAFAKKVVQNPVSKKTVQLRGENRQYLSLEIGGSQKDTLILFFGGSGCRDVSPLLNPLYGNLAINALLISLVKKGVIGNSQGTRCSDEFVSYDNLDNLVADGSALLNQLLAQAQYKNIVVAGHSEGGDVIWRLAEKIPAITHVFSRHRGLGLNNLDELKVIAKSKQGDHRKTYQQLIADLEGKSQVYGDADFILIRKKRSWQVSVRDKRNPAEVLLRSGKKVLVMMGDKDKHVPIRSMYAAHKVFCDAYSDKLTAIVKQGHGHSIDVDTEERAVELDIFARWISNETIALKQPFQKLSCKR